MVHLLYQRVHLSVSRNSFMSKFSGFFPKFYCCCSTEFSKVLFLPVSWNWVKARHESGICSSNPAQRAVAKLRNSCFAHNSFQLRNTRSFQQPLSFRSHTLTDSACAESQETRRILTAVMYPAHVFYRISKGCIPYSTIPSHPHGSNCELQGVYTAWRLSCRLIEVRVKPRSGMVLH